MQDIIESIKNRSGSSSLSFRLLAYILVFSSCITLLITILQLFADYRRDLLSIEERLIQIQESHVNGLISSLWDMNDRQTRTLMDGILSLPDISYVGILNNDNSPLVMTGKPPVGDTVDREYALSYRDRSEQQISLGTLHVVADLEGVYQRLRERLLIILGSQAVKTFLVSIFILIIFQQLVTRHLVKLARHTRSITATRQSPPLNLDRKPNSASRFDELDQVVSALNNMHADVLSANKKIQELNALLEDRVIERTRSLNQEIEERARAEEKIKASLKEKEILLKEVHHRVKNNLQVVSSLLGLQAYTMEDKVEPEILALFRESATRIKSMALVHERLQCSSDLAHVDFDHYIRQLADELFQNYRIRSDSIALDIRTEGVQVSTDQAVPCGLIVNELLSNALKHAFPDGREGRIEIMLKPGQRGMLELRVCDDGAGLPEGLDPEKTDTLGLTIVNALVEQLDGEMVLERTRGTCVRISFEGD